MEAGWAGIYPHSLDGAFIVGPHEHDRRIVTVGGLGGVVSPFRRQSGRSQRTGSCVGESTRFDFVDDLLPNAPSRKVNACMVGSSHQRRRHLFARTPCDQTGAG